jgi:integrase
MAGRAQGQIIQRGERVFLLRVPRATDASGKRLYHSETFKGSKADAKKRLTALLAQRHTNTLPAGGGMKLNDYLDRWLAAVRPKVGAHTYADYSGDLRRHIRPRLGERRLDRITALDLQGLYADMQAGNVTGRPLAPRTIRKAHAALLTALNQALKWGLLAVNPCRAVTLPKQQRREMHVLTAEEAERFRQAAAGTRFGVLFELALATGMRPGEYLALQWKHVDLKAGTVRVERALVEGDGKLSFAPPKTSRSRRTIPLPPSVTRALAAHKERQAAERPIPLDGSGLVFPSEMGGTMNERNLLRRYFRPTLAAAGLEPRKYRLYDLRHTCATLLLLAGENPKVVSERLGHASVTLTLDVYSHVLPTMQEAAADKLERLLYGSGG